MILVTVFKDRERYEADLRDTFKKIVTGAGISAKYSDIWELAKKATSKVDFTQKVNVSASFFEKKKPHEIKNDIYTIGHDIAHGRRFKTNMSFHV